MDNGQETSKIKNFTDLIAWQKAHKLVLRTYTVTKSFPKTEIYSLTNQMCRCAVSISSNISEGFSRKSNKEKIQFYYTAKGSLTELESQLIISNDLKYIDQERFEQISKQISITGKLLVGLITKTKTL